MLACIKICIEVLKVYFMHKYMHELLTKAKSRRNMYAGSFMKKTKQKGNVDAHED